MTKVTTGIQVLEQPSAPNKRSLSGWVSLKQRSRIEHVRAALLLFPFALFFGLFQIAPMVWVFFNSFLVDGESSLEHYQEIFDSAFFLQSFGNSLSISLYSSVSGLVIATVATASLHRVDCRLREWMIAFTNMTSNFTGVPLAFAFIIILGFNGAITLILRQWGWIDDFDLYSKMGLTLIYTYFQIPLALLLLYPAFDAIEDDWKEAAALLGASTFNYWRLVVIPVLFPAILGTLIILIANAVGAYASAYALTTGNYNLVTIRIASLVSGDLFLEPNLAAALSVLLMGLMALVTIVNQWLLKRSYHAKK